MGRPTTIKVQKVANGDYEITCIDDETGSATGMQIPENGYEVLKHHFRTGVMEISSDELIALPISGVVNCPECGQPGFDKLKYACMNSECSAYFL